MMLELWKNSLETWARGLIETFVEREKCDFQKCKEEKAWTICRNQDWFWKPDQIFV